MKITQYQQAHVAMYYMNSLLLDIVRGLCNWTIDGDGLVPLT